MFLLLFLSHKGDETHDFRFSISVYTLLSAKKKVAVELIAVFYSNPTKFSKQNQKKKKKKKTRTEGTGTRNLTEMLVRFLSTLEHNIFFFFGGAARGVANSGPGSRLFQNQKKNLHP